METFIIEYKESKESVGITEYETMNSLKDLDIAARLTGLWGFRAYEKNELSLSLLVYVWGNQF